MMIVYCSFIKWNLLSRTRPWDKAFFAYQVFLNTQKKFFFICTISSSLKLLEYGNALRTHKPVPTNTNKDIDVIITKLSKEVKVQLDEVTSLIVTSEALDEFPQFLVMKATQLPSDKRQALVDVVNYSTCRHK